MKQRYFMRLSYKGTNYHGWQCQPNAITVQEVIEEALSKILRQRIAVVGSGRTDTGVHARNYILHFDALPPVDGPSLTLKLNSFLPRDIAVHQIWPVDRELHARFSALSRTYRYYITTQKDPFLIDTAYRLHRTLDVEKMNRAAACLFDYEDFTSFSRSNTDVKTNNCTIMHAQWHKEGPMLIFTITANRFLRNMVRAIVGTLLMVGQNKLDIDGFRKIIEQKDRTKAGASAPAHGLFLEEISYPKSASLPKSETLEPKS